MPLLRNFFAGLRALFRKQEAEHDKDELYDYLHTTIAERFEGICRRGRKGVR
jgi:hypothetical protein